MIEIKIDDQIVQAHDGDTIIEAADRAGIYIPRFCYHKKLSIAANCRMCLVEVENGRKPVPACATPVTPDMVVFTKSKAALQAQRVVMEFLLINHPLDCPICDQGGECELQDLAMGYGGCHSHYEEPKRAVFSEDIGPLVETEMTRCIHCTRCVRFGEEVAGLRELGVTNRGGHAEIGTYVKHFLKSELSGNVVDLCPVGALTAKPSRYQERAWQLREHQNIAPHDCLGSNSYVHTRGEEYSAEREVMRIVPRENEAINQVWLSDRDRFAYEGLKHAERVYKPMMKQQGEWVETDWKRALVEIADKLTGMVSQQGAEQIAALASPSCTTEEFYLLQKMMRALGSNNIDYRLRELDMSDQQHFGDYPSLGMPIAEVENLDAILLVGSNLRFEQPLLAHRVYQASQNNDATVMAINPMDYGFVFPLTHKMIERDIVDALAQVAKAVAEKQGQSVSELANVSVSDSARAMAEQLCADEHAAIVLGEFALHHPQAAELRALAFKIAALSGAQCGTLTDGANSAGAWLAGAVPHRGAAGVETDSGKTAHELLTTDPVRAYLLLNVEPEFDTVYSAQTLAALKQAGLVVCMTSFVTDAMREMADFILPIAPYTEIAGSYVNVEGAWQSFTRTSVPHGESKPAWKVLRVLANFLQLEGFSYQTNHQVRDELQRLVDAMPNRTPTFELSSLTSLPDQLLRVANYPIYCVNGVVRRAAALQDTQHFMDEVKDAVVMNEKTAADQSLTHVDVVNAVQGEQRVTLPLNIDNRVADGLVLVPAGIPLTAGFGQHMSPIKIERGN